MVFIVRWLVSGQSVTGYIDEGKDLENRATEMNSEI